MTGDAVGAAGGGGAGRGASDGSGGRSAGGRGGGAGAGGLSDAELLGQCRVDTFRAGGKGGQHQNTTDSGVRLTHLPTGIVVTAREERSQHRNRRAALERLRRRLREARRKPKTRIPTRVPAGEKKRRLEEKRRRSATKSSRRTPEPEG